MHDRFLLLFAMLAPAALLVWSEGKPMPEAKGGAAAALLGHELILAGGTTWREGRKLWLADVDIYDIGRADWRKGPRLPSPLAYAPALATATGIEIYGGSDGSRTLRECLRFDAASGAWRPIGRLPEARVLGRAERFSDSVYYIGGASDVNDLSHTFDTVLRRRSQTGDWERVAAMPDGGRAMLATTSLNGRMYLFGGCYVNSSGKLVNVADARVFEPATGAWKRLHDLPRATRGQSAVAADDHRIFLFGGYTASEEEAKSHGPEFGFSADVLIYETTTDRYTQLEPMPLAVIGMDFFRTENLFLGAGGEHRSRARTARLLTARFSD